ncbi:tRNA (guanine(26)-N(2))-dimethyltransferase [Linum perenne]
MLSPYCVISKTLSPYSRSKPSLLSKDKNFKLNCCNPHRQTERGVQFDTGGAFYRHESSTGRDLGVLAASLYRQSNGSLRVLDAMCGCGIRSCRYLIEAGADFVMANDANDEYREVILGNLKQSAMLTLKFGGLLYLTSTDGYSSGGHRPQHSLDEYGAYVHPLPFRNEIGLRVLIGGAVREAAVLGYHVTPLFSYYAFHGPVYRVMLRCRDYGFIGYCNQCGHSQRFPWKDLGKIDCSSCSSESSQQGLVVSGPMWIGPLHTADYVAEMSSLAMERKWIGNGEGANLEKLLKQMIDESDPRLPPGYIKLDEVLA